MISVTLDRTGGQTVGFTVENHGDTLVCAAVSLLVINTVNSIERLTTCSEFTYDYKDDGGFLTFSLTDKKTRHIEAGLLIDALVLGLCSTRDEYPDEISVKEVTS